MELSPVVAFESAALADVAESVLSIAVVGAHGSAQEVSGAAAVPSVAAGCAESVCVLGLSAVAATLGGSDLSGAALGVLLASLFVPSDGGDDEDPESVCTAVCVSVASSARAIHRGNSRGYETMTKTTIAGIALSMNFLVFIFIVRDVRFDFVRRINVWMDWGIG